MYCKKLSQLIIVRLSVHKCPIYRTVETNPFFLNRNALAASNGFGREIGIVGIGVKPHLTQARLFRRRSSQPVA